MRWMLTAGSFACGFVLSVFVGTASSCGDSDSDACVDAVGTTEARASGFEIRNVGAEAVFVREIYGCTGRYFEIMSGGEAIAHDPGGCDTCEDVVGQQEYACGGCVEIACVGQTLIRIEPGATHELAWPGLTYEDGIVPAGCPLHEGCSASGMVGCLTGREASSGSYEIRLVQTTGASDCFENPDCSCPAGESSCIISAGEPGGPTDVLTTFDHPVDSLSIELQ